MFWIGVKFYIRYFLLLIKILTAVNSKHLKKSKKKLTAVKNKNKKHFTKLLIVVHIKNLNQSRKNIGTRLNNSQTIECVTETLFKKKKKKQTSQLNFFLLNNTIILTYINKYLNKTLKKNYRAHKFVKNNSLFAHEFQKCCQLKRLFQSK